MSCIHHGCRCLRRTIHCDWLLKSVFGLSWNLSQHGINIWWLESCVMWWYHRRYSVLTWGMMRERSHFTRLWSKRPIMKKIPTQQWRSQWYFRIGSLMFPIMVSKEHRLQSTSAAVVSRDQRRAERIEFSSQCAQKSTNALGSEP